jgi:hypothetical protein
LGIKEKGEEHGCRERNVRIGNKWWKILTTYSKEMKTTRRGVEDTIKENKEECMLMGGDFNGSKENPKTRWKMQKGRDGMD